MLLDLFANGSVLVVIKVNESRMMNRDRVTKSRIEGWRQIIKIAGPNGSDRAN